MVDAAVTMALMHYPDDDDPAGGFAYSWEIERLAADVILDDLDDLGADAAQHLAFRWNSMDRTLLDCAFRAAAVTAVVSATSFFSLTRRYFRKSSVISRPNPTNCSLAPARTCVTAM
jgi:urease accessory protein UreF